MNIDIDGKEISLEVTDLSTVNGGCVFTVGIGSRNLRVRREKWGGFVFSPISGKLLSINPTGFNILFLLGRFKSVEEMTDFLRKGNPRLSEELVIKFLKSIYSFAHV